MAARRSFLRRAASSPGPEAPTVRFGAGVESVRAGDRSVEDVTAELVAALTDDELLGVLDGDVGFWTGARDVAGKGYNHEPIVAGEVSRLGIPGIRFTDGPRGVVMNHSTCFPVAIARGATWDPDLETEIGEAIGAEARAQGANLFAGVCVNLLRHPGWGRAQETFGDDPVLLGAMGAALVAGAQQHVMACVKHFALNSIENARFRIDVTVNEDDLHEVYLPHFKTVIDAGCTAVMSAYNSVNGQWCGDGPTLLTEILRHEWGFEGFVMSDFVFGMRDPVGSVAAGLDLEMPFAQQRAAVLPKALAKGRLDRLDAERAASRLIAAQVRWAATVAPEPPPETVVASGAHRALARRAAARSMVLLRNEDVGGRTVLPLDLGPDGKVRSVAVIGSLAARANLGDHGSSAVHPPTTVSPIDGLRAALRDVTVDGVAGDEPGPAAAAAAAADVAVVVVGYTARDEGEAVFAMDRETMQLLPGPAGGRALSGLTARLASRGAGGLEAGGDRTRLTLRPEHEELIDAVTAANRRTVVVVIGGSAVIMEHWRQRVAAILLAWYPGMEGGHALADVLTGAVEPGGRLPFVMPTSAYHLPPFDPDATSITYDRWWGQRRLERDGHDPAYPLGFGLGYTSFEIDAVEVTEVDVERLTGRVRVTVRNTGDRPGATVVQCHGRRDRADDGADDGAGDRVGDGASPETVVRRLLGFARVEAQPSETVEIDVAVDLRPLARRCSDTGVWAIRSGSHLVEAGRYWGDPAAATVLLDVD